MAQTTKLVFEGIHNFRDMGGYETKDGRRVKKGLLYRSGELGNMTEQDKVNFQALGIQTILDYRDEIEANFNVTPTLNGVQNIRVPAKKITSNLPTGSVEELIKSGAFQKMDDRAFYKFYEELPFENPAYQQLIDLMKGCHGPILHHCSAGKDRTGVGAAIIHLILDIPIESVYEDYLKTNEYLRGNLPEWIHLLRELLPPDSPHLIAFTGVHESFLEAALNEITATYGTFDVYLEKEFGITPEIRRDIQDYYLES